MVGSSSAAQVAPEPSVAELAVEPINRSKMWVLLLVFFVVAILVASFVARYREKHRCALKLQTAARGFAARQLAARGRYSVCQIQRAARDRIALVARRNAEKQNAICIQRAQRGRAARELCRVTRLAMEKAAAERIQSAARGAAGRASAKLKKADSTIIGRAARLLEQAAARARDDELTRVAAHDELARLSARAERLGIPLPMVQLPNVESATDSSASPTSLCSSQKPESPLKVSLAVKGASAEEPHVTVALEIALASSVGTRCPPVPPPRRASTKNVGAGDLMFAKMARLREVEDQLQDAVDSAGAQQLALENEREKTAEALEANQRREQKHLKQKHLKQLLEADGCSPDEQAGEDANPIVDCDPDQMGRRGRRPAVATVDPVAQSNVESNVGHGQSSAESNAQGGMEASLNRPQPPARLSSKLDSNVASTPSTHDAMVSDDQHRCVPMTPPPARNLTLKGKLRKGGSFTVSVIHPENADRILTPDKITNVADIDISVSHIRRDIAKAEARIAAERASRKFSMARAVLYAFMLLVALLVLCKAADMYMSSPHDLDAELTPEDLPAMEQSALAKSTAFCVTAFRSLASFKSAVLVASIVLPALLGPVFGAAGAGATKAVAAAGAAAGAAATGGKRLQAVGAAASAVLAVATRLSSATRVVAPATAQAAVAATRPGVAMTLRAGAGTLIRGALRAGAGMNPIGGALGALIGVATAVLI